MVLRRLDADLSFSYLPVFKHLYIDLVGGPKIIVTDSIKNSNNAITHRRKCHECFQWCKTTKAAKPSQPLYSTGIASVVREFRARLKSTWQSNWHPLGPHRRVFFMVAQISPTCFFLLSYLGTVKGKISCTRLCLFVFRKQL